jgi:hypothetical protein
VNVGFAATPVAPFAGVAKTGAGGGGGGTVVVNVNLAEYALVPEPLDAFTCQKYLVLPARPLAAYDVAAMLL